MRGSRGEFDGRCDVDDFLAGILRGDQEGLRAQQRGRFNESDGHFIGGVEAKGVREKLVAAPEFGASRVHQVDLRVSGSPRDYRELGDDVFDLGVEEGVEQLRGPAHAVVERNARRLDQQLVQLAHRFVVHIHLLRDRIEITAGVAIGPERLDRLDEEALEGVTCPLNCVLDFVRIVLQRAQRNLLFYASFPRGSSTLRIIGRAVALRDERHDDLGIPAGSQRAGFEQRLIEANAARIDVFARLHVVQRVANERQSLKERVAEQILRLRTHLRLEKLAFHIRIHRADRTNRGSRLALPDICVPEQKLPRQIASLDAVHVCHQNRPVPRGSNAHQRQILEHFAADRPGAHQKYPRFFELLLQGFPEYHDLAVVPAPDLPAVRYPRSPRKRLP